MPRNEVESFELARSVVRKHARDMRIADASARKPRLCAERATSKAITAAQYARSTSMNDVLCAMDNTLLEATLADPLKRAAIRAISADYYKNALEAEFD